MHFWGGGIHFDCVSSRLTRLKLYSLICIVYTRCAACVCTFTIKHLFSKWPAYLAVLESGRIWIWVRVIGRRTAHVWHIASTKWWRTTRGSWIWKELALVDCTYGVFVQAVPLADCSRVEWVIHSWRCRDASHSNFCLMCCMLWSHWLPRNTACKAYEKGTDTCCLDVTLVPRYFVYGFSGLTPPTVHLYLIMSCLIV